MHMNKYLKYGQTGDLCIEYQRTRNEVNKVKSISKKRKHFLSDIIQKCIARYWKTTNFLTNKKKEPQSNVTLQLNCEMINVCKQYIYRLF